MSAEELASVRDFAVENAFGSVSFCAPVDLRGADLSRVFRIAWRSIEVYPASLFLARANKPPPGRGLNLPAILRFRDFLAPGQCPETARERARRAAARDSALFLSLDAARNELSLKAFGF